MQWARDNGYAVVTHDLDFGILLAHTASDGPSVVQLRIQDIAPVHAGAMLINVLKTFQMQIEAGALVTVEEARARVRVLPLSK
jgi:predicted nuclease of predicted toxin-antitoxin system